jgi:hypothetical protein
MFAFPSPSRNSCFTKSSSHFPPHFSGSLVDIPPVFSCTFRHRPPVKVYDSLLEFFMSLPTYRLPLSFSRIDGLTLTQRVTKNQPLTVFAQFSRGYSSCGTARTLALVLPGASPFSESEASQRLPILAAWAFAVEARTPPVPTLHARLAHYRRSPLVLRTVQPRLSRYHPAPEPSRWSYPPPRVAHARMVKSPRGIPIRAPLTPGPTVTPRGGEVPSPRFRCVST